LRGLSVQAPYSALSEKHLRVACHLKRLAIQLSFFDKP